MDADERETGDPTAIHPFLAEISKDRRKSVDGDIDTGAAALHLSVRCGSGACCHRISYAYDTDHLLTRF
jgi:hypothetical protein